MNIKLTRLKSIFLVLTVMFSSGVRSEPDIQNPVQDKLNAVVYRTPTCGCCGKWVSYLERNQFKVEDIIIEQVDEIKNKVGVNGNLSSCHTAIINGYVVEGHVPVEDILTMLNEKPDIIGISVPGMVVGSPGMEMGDRKAPYQVMSFDHSGKVKVFNRYE